MKKKLALLLIIALLSTTLVSNVAYAADGLELEISHKWTTGDSSRVQAVTTGDIDNDGVVEIVTVGYFHNSTSHYYEGELDIWSWNGTQLTLEHTEYFDWNYTFSIDTQFTSVALGNVDNDTDIEIVIAGYAYSLFIISIWPPKIVYQYQGILIVGNWNGTLFTRETFTRWPNDENRETQFFDLTVGDVDKDNIAEIVTVGYENTTDFNGVLTIWNITEGNLILETSFERLISGETIWRAVSINDLDEDGSMEIAMVGDFYDNNLKIQCATLRICTWNGTALEWETSNQWYTYSNTTASDLTTGDIDGDGKLEIVTCGYQQTADTYNVQLRIWTWRQEILTLKLSVEGGLAEPPLPTLGRTVTIADVDGDGANEIVLGLDVSIILWSISHIRIFAWQGETLITEDFKDWQDVSSVQEVVANDVDGDGKVEIITAGYTAGFMIAPTSNLGIWGVSKVSSLISVMLNPQSIVIGSQVTISGIVTNETGGTPISNAEVTIEYSRDPLPVFIHLATVTTNENGEYSYSWIPQATGQYTIRASWKGDYEHEGASNAATLTVEKASSLITVTLSSHEAKIGDAINVRCTLYPANTVPITLTYEKPDNTVITVNVNTNNAGVVTDTFVANQVGTWTIKASWGGDDVYAPAESASIKLVVTKSQSALSIIASPLTVNVGSNVTVNGTLIPAQTATITLTFTMPNGTTITDTVTTSGTFSYSMKLNQGGIWQIKASWNGNTQYEAATSPPIAVVAQAVDQMTLMLAIGGFGLGLIAFILAAFGVYMVIKKKTTSAAPVSAPPPVST